MFQVMSVSDDREDLSAVREDVLDVLDVLEGALAAAFAGALADALKETAPP
jgi:hypothetical protein